MTTTEQKPGLGGYEPLLQTRILENIEPDTNGGCWLWTGDTDPLHGYGRIYFDGVQHKAHRASYGAFVGKVGDLWVLHKCDVRPCVNPDHLYLGGRIENAADMVARGGQVRGVRCGQARLDDDMVREIRASSESSRQLEKRLPVTASMIRRIRRGQAWTHVLGRNAPNTPEDQ
jgi:hypothetical protein